MWMTLASLINLTLRIMWSNLKFKQKWTIVSLHLMHYLGIDTFKKMMITECISTPVVSNFSIKGETLKI